MDKSDQKHASMRRTAHASYGWPYMRRKGEESEGFRIEVHERDKDLLTLYRRSLNRKWRHKT